MTLLIFPRLVTGVNMQMVNSCCYHKLYHSLNWLWKVLSLWTHSGLGPRTTHTNTHSALSAGRSLGNTVLLQSHHTLKPSKLPPLEVGRHGGDKAKLPPLCFFFLSSSLLHICGFLCSVSSGVLSYPKSSLYLSMKLLSWDILHQSFMPLCDMT